MYKIRVHILALLVFLIGIAQASAELRVVTSIKPVHSLVASIMQGAGKPQLILDAQGTPHGYTLRPSKAGLLAKADIIFWIGPALETFLQKPVQTIGAAARSVELMKANGLLILPFREFDDEITSNGSKNHDHNDHGNIDPHIWLDPQNAKAMARTISDELSKADPENTALYQKNTSDLLEKLEYLTDRSISMLKPVKDQPFVTHHDGYQYFEKRFGLNSKGALIANPEVLPGIGHALKIRNSLKKIGNSCLFTEQQFPQKFVAVIAENSNTRISLLDPLGSDLKPGPALYFRLIEQMTGAFYECLSSLSK